MCPVVKLFKQKKTKKHLHTSKGEEGVDVILGISNKVIELFVEKPIRHKLLLKLRVFIYVLKHIDYSKLRVKVSYSINSIPIS